MPGPPPVQFTEFIQKVREFRPEPVKLDAPTANTVAIRKLLEGLKQLNEVAVKKGAAKMPVILLEDDPPESKAIRKLSQQVQEIAAVVEQLSRLFVSTIRDIQKEHNVTAEHLDLV